MSQFLAALILIGLVAVATVDIPNVDQRLKAIDDECSLMEDLAPPYVWGGFWGRLGFDCSGAAYDVEKQGFPVKRTTAYRMWIGYGNWGTNNIEGSAGAFSKGKFPDTIYFNYQGKMASHVGILREPTPEEVATNKKLKKDTRVFAEASSSKKYFKRTTIVQGDGRYKAILGIKKLNL